MSPVNYPNRIPLANLPTPMRPLARLSEDLGGPEIWIKRDDLTGSALTGNKVRKLEFSFAEARDRGADTVVTCGGLQSNHCRATAVAGAQLGFKVHLLLRGLPQPPFDGNHFLDHLCGAEVTCFPPGLYRSRLDDLFQGTVEDITRQGHRAHIIPLGASDATGMWGYIAAAEELAEDFDRHGIRPDHIVSATGSGGTLGGLALGAALFGIDSKIWGINVCDDAEYFQNKIREDMRSWKQRYQQSLDVDHIPINILDGHVGPGYAEATHEMRETIARVAQVEGIVLDPVYTGKAFHGLIQEIAKGTFKKGESVLFIHTGGIFGLFAQRATFGFREQTDTMQ
ncbi:D-cysteine desulfhydrase family protein [Candidatus Sumerlaeota bacterium]|nr:D-cysteine desulfhydrase family protein [Candidatus Sumerlaeota bacterium]